MFYGFMASLLYGSIGGIGSEILVKVALQTCATKIFNHVDEDEHAEFEILQKPL